MRGVRRWHTILGRPAIDYAQTGKAHITLSLGNLVAARRFLDRSMCIITFDDCLRTV